MLLHSCLWAIDEDIAGAQIERFTLRNREPLAELGGLRKLGEESERENLRSIQECILNSQSAQGLSIQLAVLAGLWKLTADSDALVV